MTKSAVGLSSDVVVRYLKHQCCTPAGEVFMVRFIPCAVSSMRFTMRGTRFWLLLACLYLVSAAEGRQKNTHDDEQYEVYDYSQEEDDESEDGLETCQCGVFLSLQVGLKEGSRRTKPRTPPKGKPVVTYDTDSASLPCGGGGNKNCINKCLDVMTKYLPKAGSVICGAVDRDVHRERAFLYIKNCDAPWLPTSFSAGKEFCCTDGEVIKC